MKTYTVISVQKDTSYEPRHDFLTAESPNAAEKAAYREGWVVVAVLAGRQVGL